MLLNLTKSTLAFALGVMVLTGCNESLSSSQGEGYQPGDNGSTDFNEKALISNLANVVTTAVDGFALQSKTLNDSVGQYCQTLISNPPATNELSSARSTWQQNMMLWQQVEMMQVGPLIFNENKLRNDIYSYPDTNTCGVDFDTMYFKSGEFNNQPYDIAERRANRKGLFALEYLLFNENANHSCTIETPPNWNDFTEEEVAVARCEYAQAVSGDIVTNADLLVEQWSGDDGFIHQLNNAGTEQSTIESEHAAVNLLSDAMFYLDSLTKDAKLATPLGLVANSCGAQACPEDVESPYANHSVENIVENLNGFEQFFSGGTGIGFVDYLTYVGDEDTAEQMTLAISAAKEQLALYEASLAQTLVDDEAQVEQTHKNVKAITDKLKTDFIHSLALELPSTSAGDND